jgi:Family of unknown function (DUF5946)
MGRALMRTEEQRKAAAGAAAEQEAYEALQCYTLEHGGAEFVHQYVVDAWMARHADEQTKPIGLTFALVGLYLHLERGFTGRQVQRVHVLLARRKQTWPSFPLPPERGSMTARDVMAVPAGAERHRAIDAWCESAWEPFSKSRPAVAALLAKHGIV